MVQFLFNLDITTLIRILFFGNLVSVILICAYYLLSDSGRKWGNCRLLLVAKCCQAPGYALLLFRGRIPDLVSVNVGNSLLLVGFYCEALVMTLIIRESQTGRRLLQAILAFGLAVFNLTELFYPDPSVRVAVASVCAFLIFLIPCLHLFLSPEISRFKQLVGGIFIIYLLLLFPRAVYAFTTSTSVLGNSLIQSISFLAPVLSLIFILPAYLLLLKEDADEVIATMAVTDSLTNLSNRYHFLDVTRRVFRRCRYNETGVALVCIDIDFLRKINESHGYIFGDTVLATLARVIRENLRPIDLSCRYGGEDFMLLLHDTDAAGAVIVANRIREAIGRLRFEQHPDFSFTVSVGFYAGEPHDEEDVELFVGRADTAMSMAKKTGRDRVVEYDALTALALNS